MKARIKTRAVEDIALHSWKSMVQVKFEDDPAWWPVRLTDLGAILKSMGMIDFYLEDEQRVGVEKQIDLVRDRETGVYEPVFRTVTQDIRDYLSGCSWDEYNRIFATV